MNNVGITALSFADTFGKTNIQLFDGESKANILRTCYCGVNFSFNGLTKMTEYQSSQIQNYVTKDKEDH